MANPRDRYHLYQSKDGLIHYCESSEVHRGVTLVWTYCEKDVPANKSFKSEEAVTCSKCLQEAKSSEAGKAYIAMCEMAESRQSL